MALDELTTEIDALDAQMTELRVKKKALAKERHAVAEIEHAAYYGLTPELYHEVKRRARFEADAADHLDDAERSKLYATRFLDLLGDARKAQARGVAQKAMAERKVQVASVGVADVGAAAKGTN